MGALAGKPIVTRMFEAGALKEPILFDRGLRDGDAGEETRPGPVAARGADCLERWPRAVPLVGTIRAQQPLTGTGVGIGVLSTGVARLVSGEAAVELLDRVMVLPGQAGEGDELPETLSVIHQLAPG